MLYAESIYEVICLGSIGYREIGNLMDAREDTSMESHTDHRIEKRYHIERLCDILGRIICLSEHDLAYVGQIVLTLISTRGEYEEYWLVPHRYEMIVHIWDNDISIPEESSSYRYTHELDGRYRLRELRYIIEIYDIMYLYRWDLESIEESLALTISYEQQISGLK